VSMGDDQHLETVWRLRGVECADGAGLVERGAVIIGNQVDIACGGIDGQGAGALAGGQGLDDSVGVGDVLTDDGEASHGGAVGGVDEAAVGIVSDCLNTVADGQGGDELAGGGVQDFHGQVVAGGEEAHVVAVDSDAAGVGAI
jgi:hypothetical protein